MQRCRQRPARPSCRCCSTSWYPCSTTLTPSYRPSYWPSTARTLASLSFIFPTHIPYFNWYTFAFCENFNDIYMLLLVFLYFKYLSVINEIQYILKCTRRPSFLPFLHSYLFLWNSPVFIYGAKYICETFSCCYTISAALVEYDSLGMASLLNITTKDEIVGVYVTFLFLPLLHHIYGKSLHIVANGKCGIGLWNLYLYIYFDVLHRNGSWTMCYICVMCCSWPFTDVANAWLETLIDVIDLLPKDVIKKDVSL